MYKLKGGFMVRNIGGQTMAVPVGSKTSEIHGMIILSESGALLWNALEEGAQVQSLVDLLTENYDVQPDVAKADVEKFLDGLRQQGALE